LFLQRIKGNIKMQFCMFALSDHMDPSIGGELNRNFHWFAKFTLVLAETLSVGLDYRVLIERYGNQLGLFINDADENILGRLNLA
jgi:hypothetical protein